MRNPETLLQPTPEATQDTGSATESAKEPVPTREVLRQTDAVTDLLRKELDALEEKLRFAEREKEPKSLFSRVFTAASPKAQEVLRATIAKRRSELEQLEGLRRLLDRQERIKLIDKFPTNRRDLAHAVDPEHAELKDVLETSWYPPRKLDVERMAAALEAGYDAGNSAAPLRILDLGGGRGFLDKLLADHLREKNVRSMVVDLDLDPEELAKGKAMYGATANLHFVASDADNEVGSLFSTQFDGIVASWVHPEGAKDYQRTIERMRPPVVIAVGEHQGSATVPIRGSSEYTKIAEWAGPQSLEVMTGAYLSTSDIEEEEKLLRYGGNVYEVHVRNDINPETVRALKERLQNMEIPETAPYRWEAELAKMYEPSPVSVEPEKS